MFKFSRTDAGVKHKVHKGISTKNTKKNLGRVCADGYVNFKKNQMMKKIMSLIASFISLSVFFPAQGQNSLLSLTPPGDYGNVHVQRLDGDSLSTAFLIWIKKEVKAHRHAWHSENVYILEGYGVMKLGDKEFEVKAGDHIFIPKNAVHSLKVKSDIPMKVLSVQAPQFNGDDRIMVE